MRRPVIIATMVIVLAGCANTIKTDAGYGSFVHAAPAAHETRFAEDAVRQLTSLYPPASTRLTLAHTTQDRFGTLLIEKLRGQGYELQESAPQAVSPTNEAPSDVGKSNGGTAFSYVLDSVDSPRMYRITLNVGHQAISRAYIAQNDVVQPAGAWVRKE